MTETTELFLELDNDIRQLLTIVHNIKIDIITGSQNKDKVEKALFLTQRIQAELYRLLR